jgi:hypothetical protein
LGFGRRIIEQMIAQLKGKTRFDWRAEGLVFETTFGREKAITKASLSIPQCRLMALFGHCAMSDMNPKCAP